MHDELRAEADHGAISRLLYHQQTQELLLIRLAQKLGVGTGDLTAADEARTGRKSAIRRGCRVGRAIATPYSARKWPNAAGRIRSQTILVIASIGTDRIAPGIPHIQNQKTSETITRTGLSVNRRARSIGVAASPSIR
jgi:hypothetical protein